MTPQEKRTERLVRKAYNWLPIHAGTNDLLFRVETAFHCGADTEFMSRLWGWSEPVIERALHIIQNRKHA